MSLHRDALRDPARHHACLRAAAAAGLAPRVIHTDDATAIAITAFVPARPLSTAPRAALLEQLAALIHRLQTTPSFPQLVDYVDGVSQLLAPLRAEGILPELDLFARFAALCAAYPRAEAPVSAHNDLNPGNLIWDGARLWIVDWEAAFASDRFVDPAHACNYFAASPDERTRLLTTVLGAPPTARDLARLWMMQQVAHMFFAAMTTQVVRAQRPTLRLGDLVGPPLAEVRREMGTLMRSPEGQLRCAIATFGELDTQLRSPRFAEAIAQFR
ncbi:MAG: phosphotransferase [Deltaproteobacteria bacterium]|nr:phosphotransferase [Deltaproteobacteria bacterium]